MESLTRNSVGAVGATSLGKISESITYNSFGELTSDSFSLSGDKSDKNSLKTEYKRDASGRIISVLSNNSMLSLARSFSYDSEGRLGKVTNGIIGEREYQYDQNGNRSSIKIGGRKINATYDAQDRLLTYGNLEFTYSQNGELAQKIEHDSECDSGGRFDRDDHKGKQRITKYTFDSFGNLKSVVLPNSKTIEYILDGQNRRIGKKINGQLVQGFIFQSQTQIAAELDGNGKLVKRFIYGAKANVPDYMVYQGAKYRIISDHVGTPKLVVKADTGKLVEALLFDEFGNPEVEFGKSTLRFGFAGGIFDRDTGLVHFGARDYDPSVGRWISKDPILFGGHQTNFYGYSNNDPINFIDPTGLDSYLFIQLGHVVIGVDNPKGGLDTFEFGPKGGFLQGLANLFSSTPAEVTQGYLPPGQRPFLSIILRINSQTPAQDTQQELNLQQAADAAATGDLNYNVFRLYKNSFNCTDLSTVGAKK